jgi:hypothetical protein
MVEVQPWCVLWKGGSLSMFTSWRRERARAYAVSPSRRRSDGWPAKEDREIESLERVLGFEMRVGPRKELNAPRFCRLILPWGDVRWSRPAYSNAVAGDDLPHRNESESAFQLWGFVWLSREIFLLDACSRIDAGHRVVESRSRWGIPVTSNPRMVIDNLEPVDRFEIHLAPDGADLVPTCYRVWIEGYKVGWPPPDPEDHHPDAVEARLSVPRTSRIRARGGVRGRSA